MGCCGCSGWMSRKSLMAADAVGCAGVKTPVVAYPDGTAARICNRGSTISSSVHTETPARIINNHFCQPIGMRIESQKRATADRPQTCRCYTTGCGVVNNEEGSRMMRGSGDSLIVWPRIGFERNQVGYLATPTKTRLAWAIQPRRFAWSSIRN
jgi:hypothetical protein